MARTDLTATSVPGPYAHAGQAMAMAAADIVDQNAVVLYQGDMLIAHNTDVGAQTVTVTSSESPIGRTKDIAAESIAAGAIHVFGPFKKPGWVQADARLWFEASAVGVEFGIIRGAAT